MNVYIETNFVLELTFHQEYSEACEELLQLSEQGRFHLVIPAYSLAEPHEKLRRQEVNRKELQLKLNTELGQLRRNSTYAERIESLTNITQLLIQSTEEASQSFSNYRTRLFSTAEIIPLTLAVLKLAAEYENLLPPQDAIVYASVLTHLQQNNTPACFINSNRKDFDDPTLTDELEQFQCKLITNFGHGLGFIRSKIQ